MKVLADGQKESCTVSPFLCLCVCDCEFFFMCVFTPSHTQRPSLSLCFSLTKGEFVLR